MKRFVILAWVVLASVSLHRGAWAGDMPDPPTTSPSENMIVNGRFVKAPDAGSASHGVHLPVGSMAIDGWTVGGGQESLGGMVHVYNRNAAHWINVASGSLTQVLKTLPGREYEVTVDFTAVRAGPQFKTLEVRAGGTTRSFSKDSHVELTDSNYWLTCQMTFTARSNQTRLILMGKMNGDYHGPIIGSVVAVPLDPNLRAWRTVKSSYDTWAYALHLKNCSSLEPILAPGYTWKTADGRTLKTGDLAGEFKKMSDHLNVFDSFKPRDAQSAKGRIVVNVVEKRTWFVMASARRQDHVLTCTRKDVWVEVRPAVWKLQSTEESESVHLVDGKPR